jgi:hypothetical protein
VVCPTQVDKKNWLGGFTHGDSFKVTQSGVSVTVHRLDAPSHGPPGSWGMDLSFKCCPGTPLARSTRSATPIVPIPCVLCSSWNARLGHRPCQCQHLHPEVLQEVAALPQRRVHLWRPQHLRAQVPRTLRLHGILVPRRPSRRRWLLEEVRPSGVRRVWGGLTRCDPHARSYQAARFFGSNASAGGVTRCDGEALHDAQTTGTVIRATSKFSARRSRKQWRSRGRSRRQTRKETTQQ